MFDYEYPGLLSDYWTQRRQSIDPEMFEPLANHQQNLDSGRLSSNPARIAAGTLNANVGKIRAGMINARMGLDVLPQMLAQYQAMQPQFQPLQMPQGLLR